VKVIVSAHGRFTAFELAAGLHQREMLHRLITPYPAFLVDRRMGTKMPVHSAPWIQVIRTLCDRAGLGRRPDYAVATLFGRFASHFPMGDADILLGWSSGLLESIAPARAAGLKIVVERGSTHIAEQTELLLKAHEACGIRPAVAGPNLIERECAEYDAADMIIVPSHFAAQSYEGRGINPSKIMINPPGVDLSQFTPSPSVKPTSPRPTILFVGEVGVRKGIPLLLEAFANLHKDAELKLVGPLQPGFAKYLSATKTKNVEVTGPLHGPALLDTFQQADIFCLPSIEDGFGMVTLQAMACGLPVVVSKATGAADTIDNGVNGIVIEANDAGTLTETLGSLLADNDKRTSLGQAARKAALTNYSWDAYVERAIAGFTHLLSN
jgi:glycosyltransferase involved in cell wall biosynthesis